MARIKGNNGDNTLSGTSGKDKIDGRDGDDTLRGLAGKDHIKGGKGDDVIDGGADDDKLYGQQGRDELLGGEGDDRLYGGQDDDLLDGGDGDDRLYGQSGSDTLYGGAGDDRLYGDGSGSGSGSGSGDQSFDDYLDGGTGNDFVQGGIGSDTVLGGAGDDIVIGDDIGGSGSGSGDLWASSVQGGGSGSGGGRGRGSGSGSGSGQGSGEAVGFADYLDGGAGNDIVLGGGGDDEARYGVTENLGATDKYAGGRGIDTLTLDMTRADWFRPEVQADIANFLAFVAANTSASTGEANSAAFEFTAFDLTVREFETLRIFVDGVEMTPEDDPVTAVADFATVNEDDAATSFPSVLGNDDVPDLAYSVRLVSGPAQGVLVFDAGADGAPDGRYSFDPAGDFEDLPVGASRDVTFVYEVTDADGDTDQATVTITVTGSNDAPVITSDAAAAAGAVTESGADEDGVIVDGGTPSATGTLTSSDVDTGATATWSGDAAGTYGSIVIDPATGVWTYTLDNVDADTDVLAAGATVTESFVMTVTDDQGATASATVTVTITGTNDAPTLSAGTGAAVEDGSAIGVDLAALAGDVDSDDTAATLTYALVSGPAEGTASVSGATLSFDPLGDFQDLAVGETRDVVVRVSATDQHGATATNDVTITVTGTNDAPVVRAVTGTASEDGPGVTLTADFTDLDANDTHMFSIDTTGTLGAVTNNGDGTFTYDPNGQFESLAVGETATDSFTYTVDDGNGGVATNTMTVQITGTNDAPIAQPVSARVDENAPGAAAFTAEIADSATVPNAGLFYVLDYATQTLREVFRIPGTIDSTAQAAASVQVSNGAVLSLNGNNADWGALFSIIEDGQESIVDPSLFELEGYSGASRIFSSGGVPLAAVYTDAVSGATLQITVPDAPTPDGPTTYSVTAQINQFTDNAVGNIDVGAVAFTSVPQAAPGLVTISADAADVDGDALTYTVDDSGTLGAVVNNGDGTFTYSTDNQFESLAVGQSTTDSFTYTVDDGNGGTDTETVTVTVNGQNDGPVAVADTLAVMEVDGTGVPGVTGSVALNDTDVDAGAVLSFALDAPVAGLTMAGDGSYSFDPSDPAYEALAAGETQVVLASYTVTDDQGASDQSTLNITVTGTNDAPVAQAVTGTASEDGPGVTVSADFTDPDARDTHTFSVDTTGTQGAVTNNGDGTFTYDPNGQFESLAVGETATDSFTYTVDDGNGGTDTETVTVTVNGQNDGPVAQAISAMVGENASDFDGFSGGFGAADIPNSNYFYVVDYDAGTVAQVPNTLSVFTQQNAVQAYLTNAGVQNGLLFNLNPNGSDFEISVVAIADGAAANVPVSDFGVTGDYTGATSTRSVLGFDYFIFTDSTSPAGDDITISLSGTPTSRGPADVAFTILGADFDDNVDGRLRIDGFTVDVVAAAGDGEVTLVADFADVDNGAVQTFSVDTTGTQGTVTDNGDGTFTYATNGRFETLAVGETATDSFTYTVDDGLGGTATETATVTVSGMNDAPVAADDSNAGDAVIEEGFANVPDGTATGNVLLNDTDIDASDVLQVTGVTGTGASSSGAGFVEAVGTYGSVRIFADGTYAYTLDNADADTEALEDGDLVIDSFTYTVSDGNVGTSSAVLRIDILGATDNTPPVANDDTFTVDEDSGLTVLDLLGNDTDLQSATQTLRVDTINGETVDAGIEDVILLENGVIRTLADGTVRFEPGANFNGVQTFEYTVTDGLQRSDTATATVNVAPVNDAPVAFDDVFASDNAVVEDVPTVLDITANDVDLDVGQTLGVFSINGSQVASGDTVSISGGSLRINTDGTVTFTSDLNATGPASFSYVATDGALLSNSADVDITVVAAADAPTLSLTTVEPGNIGSSSDSVIEPIGGDVVVAPADGARERFPTAVALNDGGFVVAWTDQSSSDGSGSGVFAQRFNEDGTAFGSSFQVNTTSGSSQQRPSAAALADGGFIIGWDGVGTGDNGGVFFQRYAEDGSAVGGETRLNQFTSSAQSYADFIPLEDGGWVAHWSSDRQDGNAWGIISQRFDASGDRIGSEQIVNNNRSGSQLYSEGNALSDGGWVITWSDSNRDGSGWATIVQRFDANGNEVGGELVVNTTTSGSQIYSDSVLLADGTFVVAWYGNGFGDSAGVFFQRFGADGTKLGGEQRANEVTASTQVYPNLAATGDGGFVVSWSSFGQSGDTTYDIFARAYEADGTAKGAEFRVNDQTFEDQYQYGFTPADGLITLANGNLVQIWEEDFGSDGIEFRIIQAPALTTRGFEDAELSIGLQAALADTDGSETLRITLTGFPSGATFNIGSAVGASWVIENAQDVDLSKLVMIPTADFSGTFDLTAEATATETSTGQSASTYATTEFEVIPVADIPELSLGNGVSTEPKPIGSDFQLNTFTASNQQYLATTELDGGGFVALWSSISQDGSAWGVYQQRFDASGAKVGPETRVNTDTPNSQIYPSADTLANGDYVVVWENNASGRSTIEMQRYQSDGTPVGVETLVAANGSGTFRPVVFATTDGGYVVSWQAGNGDGSSDAVFAQRFDDAGDAVGGTFRVNSYVLNSQREPAGVGLEDGGFAIFWGSVSQDGSGQGVYGQLYDANGGTRGSEFRVNAFTSGDQTWPSAAPAGDGGFVVTWSSVNQDGSSWGVFARRYDADGTALGSEFQVNSYNSNAQYYSSVVGLPDDGFLIVWSSYGQDGGDWGQFGQRYDAEGTKVGGEFQINANSSGHQFNYGFFGGTPIAVMDDGNVVALWDWAFGSLEPQARIIEVSYGERVLGGGPVDIGLAASLADTDGSETLTISLEGFPDGTTFSEGALDGAVWVIENAQDVDLSALRMNLPPDFTGVLRLTATATATEAGNGDAKTVSASADYQVIARSSVALTFDGADPLADWLIFEGPDTGAQTGVEVLSSFSGVLPDGVTLGTLPDGKTFFTEDNAGNGDFLAVWSGGGGDIDALASFVGTTRQALEEDTPLVFDVVEQLPDGSFDIDGSVRYSERAFEETYPNGSLPASFFVNIDENLQYEERREALIEGSAIKRIFEDVNVGDILEFDFFFYTEDVNVGDTAYVGLSGVGSGALGGDTINTQDPDVNIVPVGDLGEYGTVGWVRDFQIEITEEILGGANSVEVKFAVVNVADTAAPTGLFLDNVEIVDSFLF